MKLIDRKDIVNLPSNTLYFDLSADGKLQELLVFHNKITNYSFYNTSISFPYFTQAEYKYLKENISLPMNFVIEPEDIESVDSCLVLEYEDLINLKTIINNALENYNESKTVTKDKL